MIASAKNLKGSEYRRPARRSRAQPASGPGGRAGPPAAGQHTVTDTARHSGSGLTCKLHYTASTAIIVFVTGSEPVTVTIIAGPARRTQGAHRR